MPQVWQQAGALSLAVCEAALVTTGGLLHRRGPLCSTFCCSMAHEIVILSL